MSAMDEIFGANPNRPDHPDFWKLSEIILALKADMQENQGDLAAQEAAWRKHYEGVGDFDSIAYCARQAAIQIAGLEFGSDYQRVMRDPMGRAAFVGTVQAYFDGFIMGALLERSRHEQQPDGNPASERPRTDCCGYDLVWVCGHWEHDAAPSLWGDDHDADAPPPEDEEARRYWDEQDGVIDEEDGDGT